MAKSGPHNQIVFLLLLCASACGYNFQGSGSTLPPDVKTVAIKMTENNTTVPALGVRFTEKLRSRFDRYGVVKIVDFGDEADAVLITKITDLTTSVADVTAKTDIALEQDLIFTISADLRRKNGQILYTNPAITVHQRFGQTSDVVVTSSSAFAQGGIGAGTLSSLNSREVTRSQQEAVLEDLMDEAARKLYLDAVASEF